MELDLLGAPTHEPREVRQARSYAKSVVACLYPSFCGKKALIDKSVVRICNFDESMSFAVHSAAVRFSVGESPFQTQPVVNKNSIYLCSAPRCVLALCRRKMWSTTLTFIPLLQATEAALQRLCCKWHMNSVRSPLDNVRLAMIHVRMAMTIPNMWCFCITRRLSRRLVRLWSHSTHRPSSELVGPAVHIRSPPTDIDDPNHARR